MLDITEHLRAFSRSYETEQPMQRLHGEVRYISIVTERKN